MASSTSDQADKDVGSSTLDAAMSWTIDEVYPVLRVWFRRRVQEEFTADDLVQETMLSAWTARSSLRDPDAVGPWLFQIARNVLWMHHRASGRRSIVSADATEEVSHRVYDQPTKPFEDWLIDTIEIRELLIRLTPTDREALVLHDYNGIRRAPRPSPELPRSRFMDRRSTGPRRRTPSPSSGCPISGTTAPPRRSSSRSLPGATPPCSRMDGGLPSR